MGERRRIIEGTWTCTSCDTADIPGSQKVCSVCGNPREDEEAKFNFGKVDASGKSDRESVTDASKLELAAAGADWYCASCGGANKGNAEKCTICGDGDPASRLAKKPAKPKNAPPSPPPPASGGGAGAAMGVAGCGVLGFVGVLAVLILGFIVAAMWTSESAGKVEAMRWERSVQTESFTQVVGEKGWKGDLDVGASVMPKSGQGEKARAENLRDCVKGEKSPKKCEQVTKKVECGTEEKCEVKDKGNGFAEEICKDVPKYCDEKVEECKEAVFDEKCTYDTWTWKSKGAPLSAKGTDNAPKWPDAAAPGALDRQVKKETYAVDVSFEGGKGAYEPEKAENFTKLSVGQKVVVTTNALGTVTDVEPAK